MSQPPSCDVTCTTATPSNANLFNTPCSFNSTVWANCQAACLSPGYQFSSASSILGCDKFSKVQDFDNPNKNAACNTTYINAVLDMFNGCMAQYCESPDSTLNGCPQTNVQFGQAMCGGDGDSDDAAGVMSAILTLADPGSASTCQSLNTNVNSDIGGIGVFITYIIQLLFLGLLLWLLLMTGPWREVLLQKLQRHRKQTPADPDQILLKQTAAKQPTKSASRKAKAKNWLRSFFQTEFGVLLDTASDLQETQCFFMIASQLALIKAVASQGSFLPGSNYTQLQNNFLLAIMISMITIIPAGHAQAVIAMIKRQRHIVLDRRGVRVEKRERRMTAIYSQLVFAVTAVLWFVGFVAISLHVPGQIMYLGDDALGKAPELTTISNTTALDKCGKNPPPIIYCAPDNVNPVRYAVLGIMFGFPIAILVPVVWRSALATTNGFIWLHNLVGKRWRWRQLQSFPNYAIWNPGVWLFLLSIVQYLVGLGFLLTLFLKLAKNGGINDQEWSLGQLIAVFTFVPNIVKFIFKAFYPQYDDAEEQPQIEGDDQLGRPEKVPHEDCEDEDTDGYDEAEPEGYSGGLYNPPSPLDAPAGMAQAQPNEKAWHSPQASAGAGNEPDDGGVDQFVGDPKNKSDDTMQLLPRSE